MGALNSLTQALTIKDPALKHDKEFLRVLGEFKNRELHMIYINLSGTNDI